MSILDFELVDDVNEGVLEVFGELRGETIFNFGFHRAMKIIVVGMVYGSL
jgi:hypothetical protein